MQATQALYLLNATVQHVSRPCRAYEKNCGSYVPGIPGPAARAGVFRACSAWENVKNG